MKALLINIEMTLSGASLMLFRIAKFLLSRGYEVSVMSVAPAPGPLTKMYLDIGVSLVDEARPAEYRIAIANTIGAGPAVSELGPRLKTIWWIHEGDNGLTAVLSDPAVYTRAFACAAAIVFPARELHDTIYRSFIYQLPPERLVVLPNGVDLPDRIPVMPRGDKIRIVSVATVDQRKCQGDLLLALDKLDRPDIEAVFVGKKYWLSDAGKAVLDKDRADGGGGYRFLGELPHEEAIGWLASADIFAHPAGIEAHPLAPIEAGLLHKPVVLADIAVYRGLWRHGHNCLMHPVGDIELLAALIDGLCNNPLLRKRLGQGAHEAAKGFTGQEFLRGFDEVLSRVTSTMP